MILDFEAYMESCYKHLNQKQGENANYYEKVDHDKLIEIKGINSSQVVLTHLFPTVVVWSSGSSR